MVYLFGGALAIAIGVALGWNAGAPTWRLLVFVAGSTAVTGAAMVAAPDRRRGGTPPHGVEISPAPVPDMAPVCPAPPETHGRMMAIPSDDEITEPPAVGEEGLL